MIGEVTSGTFGPSVNGPIAMGFVDQIFQKKIQNFSGSKRKKISSKYLWITIL